ncbi:hypothetical protein PG988_003765 [Apiospora saccharicola]
MPSSNEPAAATDAHEDYTSDGDEFFSDDSDAEMIIAADGEHPDSVATESAGATSEDEDTDAQLEFKDGIGRLLQGYNAKNQLYPLQLDIDVTKAQQDIEDMRKNVDRLKANLITAKVNYDTDKSTIASLPANNVAN